MSGDVIGTGVDLVENERVERVCQRWGRRFKNKVFLPGEQAYCEAQSAPSRHYASRFAAKEAVAKAFGTGIGGDLGWLDIEVVRDAGSGAPAVRLSANGREFAARRGVERVLISISQTRAYAIAQALIVGMGSAVVEPT